MLRNLFVCGLAALALAGCVTAKNTLSTDDIASLRFAGAEVRFAPDAVIQWGDGERAYAASKGQPATESDNLARTPEGQAYLRNTIATKLKAAMEGKLAASLRGARPVRAIVTVKSLVVTSAVQRVILGGHHGMTGDVTLADAKTGAAVLSYDGQHTLTMGGQGLGGALLDAALLPDAVDRVVDNYASTYNTWLTHNQAAAMTTAHR